jgi:hypothetical protein
VTCRKPSALVESFYARDGRGHVKCELSSRAVDFCRAMQLIAEGTYLTFKGGIYKQSAGLAICSPASGDIANLYLCTLEDLALGPVRASGALLFYCRYIDDALALSVMEEADVVAECITGLDSSGALKLTTPGAAPQVDYLDLVLSVSPGKAVYRCHQKSPNRYLYIPFHSHQPQALQRAGFAQKPSVMLSIARVWTTFASSSAYSPGGFLREDTRGASSPEPCLPCNIATVTARRGGWERASRRIHALDIQNSVQPRHAPRAYHTGDAQARAGSHPGSRRRHRARTVSSTARVVAQAATHHW